MLEIHTTITLCQVRCSCGFRRNLNRASLEVLADGCERGEHVDCPDCGEGGFDPRIQAMMIDATRRASVNPLARRYVNR